MSVKIWHNPRCSKSRATLAILEEKGVDLKIIPYLETPPSEAELDTVLTHLGLEPRELMRKGEEAYKANNLGDETMTRAALIAAMVKNPILIERPVVLNGEKAAIGRPPESVLEIL